MRASTGLLLLLIGTSASALAQPAGAPPPDGLYEDWSPVTMAPVGPLRRAPDPDVLPRWLRVQSTGPTTLVTFEPEGRIRWRLRFGAHGLVEKRTEVDGVAWSHSTFIYDASGHLVRKEVRGEVVRRANVPPATDTMWTYRYRTDARGRVIERIGTRVLRHPWGSRNLVAPTTPDRLAFQYRGNRILLVEELAGVEARRDIFDAHGRRLRTEWGDPARLHRRPALIYARDRSGRLRRVTRVLDGRRRRARANARDTTVASRHVAAIHHASAERHELHLLLGSPTAQSRDGVGAERRARDTYSDGCWLNAPSSFELDAADLLVSTFSGCICGFCVDAALPVRAQTVLGEDRHWTRGPWIRLDGRVDVTADHEVMTPTGPREAGALHAGDEVLTEAGTALPLRSVERLPFGPERLGLNLRTESGSFSAGGIVFASESPCTPGSRSREGVEPARD